MQSLSPKKKHQSSTSLRSRGRWVNLPDLTPRKNFWKRSRFFPLAALVAALEQIHDRDQGSEGGHDIERPPAAKLCGELAIVRHTASCSS